MRHRSSISGMPIVIAGLPQNTAQFQSLTVFSFFFVLFFCSSKGVGPLKGEFLHLLIQQKLTHLGS